MIDLPPQINFSIVEVSLTLSWIFLLSKYYLSIYFWNTKRVTSFAHVSESPSVLQLRPTETD